MGVIATSVLKIPYESWVEGPFCFFRHFHGSCTIPFSWWKRQGKGKARRVWSHGTDHMWGDNVARIQSRENHPSERAVWPSLTWFCKPGRGRDQITPGVMTQREHYIDSGAPASYAKESNTIPRKGRRAFLEAQLTLPLERVFFLTLMGLQFLQAAGEWMMAALALELLPRNQRFSDISIKSTIPLEEADTVKVLWIFLCFSFIF